ncbi:hypothetical protein LCDV1gp090 [Lymphocystis disease virus 1]|uniref:hypothetical protein n=1 Tax=Fish lymphocystis disease virus TaxID=36363 RepID=UPI0000161EB2|nr:hypothetical protein LCDV1gp090 [Lymphocystis disease virus 1]
MNFTELQKEALKLGCSAAETLTETALKVFIKNAKKATSNCKLVLKSDLLEMAQAASITPYKSTGKAKTKYELCLELEEKQAFKVKVKNKKTEVEKSIQNVLEAEYQLKLDQLETLQKVVEEKEKSLSNRERVLMDKELSLEKEQRDFKKSLLSQVEEDNQRQSENFIKILKQKDLTIEHLKVQAKSEIIEEQFKEAEEVLLKQAELIKETEDARIKRELALRQTVKTETEKAQAIKEKYLTGLTKLKEVEKTTKTTVLEQLKKDRKRPEKLTDDEVNIRINTDPRFERLFKTMVNFLLETNDHKIYKTITIKTVIQSSTHQQLIDYAKKQFNLQVTKYNSKDDIMDKILQAMMDSVNLTSPLPDEDDVEELNSDLAVFDVAQDTTIQEEKAFEMKKTILNWSTRQIDVNSVDRLLTELQSAQTTTTDLVKVQKIVFNALGLLN